MTLPPIQPIAPTWRKEPFDHPEWLFEVKYDGFRALCFGENGRCSFVSRRGNVFTRFDALCEQVASALCHDIVSELNPHWMGGIGFIGSKPVYNAVMSADLLLMVGTDYPYSNFLPNRPVVVQIDERPEVLGRRAPTALGVLGSARPTLKLLIEQVAPKTDTSHWDRLTGQDDAAGCVSCRVGGRCAVVGALRAD